MYYTGSFLTQTGESVSVNILTRGVASPKVEINADGGNIFFTDDPVEITSRGNGPFDHILRQSATIHLLTRELITDFFCTSCMDAVVNIFKGDRCIFAGFIEPQAYSQDYNETFDELELSCIDALSALQYAKYSDIGKLGVVYNSVKVNAGQRTFADITTDIFTDIFTRLNLADTGKIRLLYDGSKALDKSADRYGILSQISVSELLFLGDDEDDVWEKDKVLEALLKYLNLHIIQDGLDFYIFSWETLKAGKPCSWKNLTDGSTMTTTPAHIAISLDNTAASDTTISIGEVFNQIQLTCNIEDVDTIIESPLDEEHLSSPYKNRQRYMSELSSDGEGIKAFRSFNEMVHATMNPGEPHIPSFEDAAVTDWYIQVMNHSSWIFREPGTGDDLISKYCKEGISQEVLPNLFGEYGYTGIFSLGKVEYKLNRQDNSPIDKLSMDNYMIISIDGNCNTDQTKSYPNENTIKRNIPLAVYNGHSPGTCYSPEDPDTTNYIVLSGKIILNPFMQFTADYPTLFNAPEEDWIFNGDSRFWHKTVDSRNNEDGRYYTQKYYTGNGLYPAMSTKRGLVPFTGTGPEIYEYKYAGGEETDKVSKVPMLACMLVIGDKCVVETGSHGQIQDFKWTKFKTREECADDDEYYTQCFYIGFDPKLGDYIVGTEFDFQNNINFNLNINASGIAIPIKQADMVSGSVKFMILGPVNYLYGQELGDLKKSAKWYRYTRDVGVPVLPRLDNIILKDFSVKLYSDNGFISDDEDNDLIYMSDTNETFVNKKDDIDFDINSALTQEERSKLGIKATINLSTALVSATGLGLLSIYDHNKQRQAKPEQLYVDSYYAECHVPRIEMKHKVIDKGSIASMLNVFSHPALPAKKFYVLGISRNLMEGYAEMNLKEIEND